MWKARKNARFTHHFREEFINVKMAIREKFTRFKKIFTPGVQVPALLCIQYCCMISDKYSPEQVFTITFLSDVGQDQD